MNSGDIKLFIERAELLGQCSFFSKGNKISATISYKSEEGVQANSKIPSRESIESLGMRIRVFIGGNELLRFNKFLNHLIACDPKNEKAYKEYLRVYDQITKQSLMVIREEKDGFVKEYTAWNFMWDLLYSDYFHLDKEKRKRIEHFKHLLGGIPETMALAKLHQLSQLIIHLASFLKKQAVAEKPLE